MGFAGPILLLTECFIKVNAIEKAVQQTGMRLVQLTRDGRERAYQMAPRNGRAEFHGVLLLLDLRETQGTVAEALKQINGGVPPRDAAAAILVRDIESQVGPEFRLGKCCQMNGQGDPSQLVQGLRAFWDLWTHVLTKVSPGPKDGTQGA